MNKIKVIQNHQTIAAVVVGAIFIAGGIYFLQSSHAATGFMSAEPEGGTVTAPATKVTDTTASGGQAVKFGQAATNCTPDALLVNPCRPWLGAFAKGYPNVTGWKNDILDHERRIGRQLDIVHEFHDASSTPLNASEIEMVGRPNTILLANWKPSANWVDSGGGNATVNAKIDGVADRFNSLRATNPGKKVILTLYHEPENDVSSGVTCTTLKGSAGSPAQYRAMWANVRNRFNAKGVNNVVWAVTYMGFSGWDCMMKDLWPGNSLVDWVMYDPYSGSNSNTFDNAISYFYNWMSNNSDSTHAYTSKPWGLAEFGIGNSNGNVADQPHTYQFYRDGKTAVETKKYPRIKAYVVFDYAGVHDSQTSYVTITHTYDAQEEAEYKNFAQSAAFRDP